MHDSDNNQLVKLSFLEGKLPKLKLLSIGIWQRYLEGNIVNDKLEKFGLMEIASRPGLQLLNLPSIKTQ